MEPIVQFVSTLFASRTQAHVFHLQTTSFAQHSALNTYYDEIVGLTDGLIESYQGKYGIIRGYSSPATFREDDDTIKYFEGLVKYVELSRERLPQDSYLQNQVDEIVALLESTLYKLKNLR
jgi:hypothetical protein